MNNKFHELLMPIGSFEKIQYAFEYGADAIYLGAKSFSLRARSSNFDFSDLQTIVDDAHKKNKKVYLVVNIICHNSHVEAFSSFCENIKNISFDGMIVADPFIFWYLKKFYPKFNLQVSTQQSTCNSKAALFWKRNGASRIVLAREVSYEELKLFIEKINSLIEIEYFIHGAVCISYSGRCTMSNNFSYRDANVGGCAQSCRWQYNIESKDRKFNQFLTMSAKDMNLVNDFEKLLKLPIHSFKIEGRMKSIHYIATVANCYRYLIDKFNDKDLNEKDILKASKELRFAENRETSVAWFNGTPNESELIYFEKQQEVNQIFAFTIEEKISVNTFKILSRNFFTIQDKIEIVLPKLKNIILNIKWIKNDLNEKVDIVNTPMKYFVICFDNDIEDWNYKIARIYK